MIRQVRETIRKHNLFTPGDRVLAAMSGGSDSVGMLAALRELAPSLGIRISVAHLNHGIRGASADEDETFVRELAQRWRLPCLTGRADVPAQAKRDGVSLEMAAREARYTFLAETAGNTKATVAATAHTADDQAETVLLKLGRGAGAAGLSGMARRTALKGLSVVRPMLDVGREEIRDFLRSHGLTWREDESNEDTAIPRNRVRHKILPFLEAELNPAIRETLVRTADVLGEEDAWLDELSRRILELCLRKEKGPPGELDWNILNTQPPAAIRRVVRLWLAECGLPPGRLDYDGMSRLEALMAGPRGSGQVTLSGEWIVERRYDRLAARPARQPAGQSSPSSFRKTVRVPGETRVQEIGLRVVTELRPGMVKDRPKKIGAVPAQATIRATTAGKHPLILRSWQPGDRMKPFGIRGTKKLQDIFVDGKVPAAERGRVPVFECGGEIVWIPGYRVGRGWEVRKAKEDALHIRVEGSLS